MNADLRDRLYRRMIESERPWGSDEIAREALRIVSDAARADRLISAMLVGDPRFIRTGEATWSVRAASAPKLDDLSYILADAPPANPGEAPLLFLQPYDPRKMRAGAIVTVRPDGSGLEPLASALQRRLLASASATAVRIRLHRLERLAACASNLERLLDLTTSLRSFGLAVPDKADRQDETRAEGRLALCRAMLEALLDRAGTSSLDELESRLDLETAGERVDFSRFHFGRGEIDAIPSRPGVYRFRGDAGQLLYIGKSRDLRRRVSSYFRPLAPDHRRRAQLLEAVRDLEWETMPSELEALIFESESIRRDRPPFNTQVEIHPESDAALRVDCDLAFVICEGDPDEVSVFFVRDQKPWGRARLTRESDFPALSAAVPLARAWWAGVADRAPGFRILDRSEAALVLRYLKLNRDRLDIVRRNDFTDPDGVAVALATLALRERPSWEPWTLREPAAGEPASA